MVTHSLPSILVSVTEVFAPWPKFVVGIDCFDEWNTVDMVFWDFWRKGTKITELAPCLKSTLSFEAQQMKFNHIKPTCIKEAWATSTNHGQEN